MSRVATTCRLPLRAGAKPQLLDGLRLILDEANREAGTELYLIFESAFEDDVVWVVELYRDEAAYIAHRGSEVHKALEHQLGELLEGPAILSFLRPVDMKVTVPPRLSEEVIP